MSIDVEDWFQVENLKGVIARDTWDEQDLRVERNTDRMLELMDTHGVKCTCFIQEAIAYWAHQTDFENGHEGLFYGAKPLNVVSK